MAPTEVHAPAAVVIHADPTVVREIVFNVLANAAKCSPRRTHIDVSVLRRQDDAEITVRDRGWGISSTVLSGSSRSTSRGPP